MAEEKGKKTMKIIPERPNFPALEEEILAYWKEINAFEESLKQSEGKKEFSFYDGPPFATGLPHYGHILAGTIKDTVTRYAHQTGHHVSRRFGWDCHGLPVEYEIDQKLGIKSKDDVMKMGVEAYNNECRSIVQRYTSEWRNTVTRMGRWIDFDNDYKTMDLNYMESVWWVFKTLQEKGLVYRGFKVMPYSTACTTPLSNFEKQLNYKDVKDPAITVSFPLTDEPNTMLLAWTTTPWTLPSNVALCVNEKLTYVKIKDEESGNFWILGKTRLDALYPAKKKKKKGAAEEKKYTIIEEFKGDALVGKTYTPLFDYFADRVQGTGWKVLSDDYVTDDSGTGIVHQAPAFGEDDFRVCMEGGVIKKGEALVCPIDDSGLYTEEVKDFKGMYVKDADKPICKHLKNAGRLIRQEQHGHSYPHCWRSDTPLIYKAVPSWFINVESMNQRLLDNNDQTYWVPQHVRDGRFRNWLANAHDWAVSRNRYWGCPLPIWVSDDGEETEFIGSIAELKARSGLENIEDIHKDKVDLIELPSKRGKEFGTLKRVPEVFDCWFESGSMPYAQQHYPFENKEVFEKDYFPADFIAEGLDQTRGWFYTLMVISTGLFDKPAFKNLIVNGLVLAEDGKKMSKRLKNYPDPLKVVGQHGADALRLYLINSPIVRAEPLKFRELGVKEIVKTVFLPWYHANRLFIENALVHSNGNFQRNADHTPTNIMDVWILSSLNTLIESIHREMKAYHLYAVIPELVLFINQLCNWYLRLNRNRFKGYGGPEDTEAALQTLFQVLYTLCSLMAPLTPFLVETMYQNLKLALPEADQMDSVHYLMLPEAVEAKDDSAAVVARQMERMQMVIELGRNARDIAKCQTKNPLQAITVVHQDEAFLQDVQSLAKYVTTELNIKELKCSSDTGAYVTLRVKPNRRAIGQRLGKKAGGVSKGMAKLTQDQIRSFQAEGSIEIAGEKIVVGDMDVCWEFSGDAKTMQSAQNDEVIVVLDMVENDDLKKEGLARGLTSRVQQLRKEADLLRTDPVEIFVDIKDAALQAAFAAKQEYIIAKLRKALYPVSQMPDYAVRIIEKECDEVNITIVRACPYFKDDAIKQLNLTADEVAACKKYLCDYNYTSLLEADKVAIALENKQVEFVKGVQFTLDPQ